MKNSLRFGQLKLKNFIIQKKKSKKSRETPLFPVEYIENKIRLEIVNESL